MCECVRVFVRVFMGGGVRMLAKVMSVLECSGIFFQYLLTVMDVSFCKTSTTFLYRNFANIITTSHTRISIRICVPGLDFSASIHIFTIITMHFSCC